MNNTLTLNYGADIAIDDEKSPYNPDFVKKIMESIKEYKEGKYEVIDDIKNLWNILGNKDNETGIKLEIER